MLEMTVRFVRLAVFALLVLGWVVPAQASKIEEAWCCCVRDFKRRHCWPRPFVCPDRHDVRAPLALMVHNGWRAQNTLTDHHFVDGTGDLTEAGRHKLRWILTEAPPQHRLVYVHRTADLELTAQRVAQAQQFVVENSRDTQLPAVYETDKRPHGWPAARADLVGRKFEDSQPSPRLPEVDSNSAE
jgi:hypothetical protein